MTSKDKVRNAYHSHKSDAKRRGIVFLMTYEQWCVLWIESGKWEERGPKRGQYVMARYGDQGAYEIGNVRICLGAENLAERNRLNPPPSGDESRWKGKDPSLMWKNPAAADAKRGRTRKGINIWAQMKDVETARVRKSQSQVLVAAKRIRNERGCFVRTN